MCTPLLTIRHIVLLYQAHLDPVLQERCMRRIREAMEWYQAALEQRTAQKAAGLLQLPSEMVAAAAAGAAAAAAAAAAGMM